MHVVLITGAALIGLPILLHLIMRQEPKRLPFPAFRFLKLRRRINQRKLRLRHLLLLLLRMFLIALIAFALFQPTLLSNRFNIKGEQAIACVVVIDTSPSMGYVVADRSGLSEARQRGLKLLEESDQGPWTALDDARFRAMELIDELPPGSRVAVIDTSDRGDAYPALSLPEARKKIREMKKPRASSRSVTQTLELAYNVFVRIEQDAAPGQENMPRLLCIFSDRTVPSWDSTRLPDLLSLRDRVPPPGINSVYVDVGVDKPLNLAITGIEMKPQIVDSNRPVEFAVTLEATGSIQENTVLVRFDEETETLKQAVRVEPGIPREVTFRRDGLKPGLHQAEITLQTADALPNDNIRYLTFRVREPRKVLIVADAPRPLGAIGGGPAMIAKVQETTALWRIALEARAWYACDIATTTDFLAWKPAQLGQYEAIVFAALVDPPAEVWDKMSNKVSGYVSQGGGQLVVVPGAEDMLVDGANKPPPGYANELLPGPFKKWITVDRFRKEGGVQWTWNALKTHPLLNDFKEWLKNPKIDFVAKPPQTWGYWEVEVKDKPSVVVAYADADESDQRRPAVLWKEFGQRGRVLVFTTPMDGRLEAVGGAKFATWNDYPATSFHLVLTNLALRFLLGDVEDQVFNYVSGQSILVKWPLDAATRSKTYYLYGPDVADADVVLTRNEKESFLRLKPEKLRSAGNYEVISDPSDKEHPKWHDGFSLNPSGEESNLDRVPIEQIEDLLGPDSVTAADKERKLRDILSGKFSTPIELFPFLMILLLLFLAFENLLSNKFYKQVKPPADVK
jgi:hypothetical protein